MMKLLKALLLGVFVQLIACAHYAPAQTGVYFYKGLIDKNSTDENSTDGNGQEKRVLADLTFEFTDSICELVITVKGVNESYLCSTKTLQNQTLRVFFEAFGRENATRMLNVKNLKRGDELFSLRLTQAGYVTDWASIIPSKQDLRSGTYFLHTYQK